MNDEARQFTELTGNVSKALDADLYMISGRLYWPADDTLINCVRDNRSKPNGAFFLTTYGGGADEAYRMARYIQLAYSSGKVIVFIQDACKSAGTLLAICASEIVMSPTAQFGPLDVQIGKPDELTVVVSGLTPSQALACLKKETFDLFEHWFLEIQNRSRGRITTKTAAEIATKMAIGLLQPIYEQFDPLRLAEFHRNLSVAKQYGERLNAGNLKPGALDRLIYEYPSHEFVIDRKESNVIFKAIRDPSEDEKKLMDRLQGVASKDMRAPAAVIRHIPINAGDKSNGAKSEKAAT